MSEVSRPVFYLFPPWMKVLFYSIAFAATLIFLYGMWRRVRRYARGAPDGRGDRLVGRFGRALADVATSSSVGRGDRFAGWAHFLIAWGWVLLFVGTVILVINEQVVGFFGPDWHFWHGPFYLWYSLILDCMGALFLIGLGMMAWRRRRGGVRLDYARAGRPAGSTAPGSYIFDDWWFLGLMLGVGITGFLIEAVRIAETFPEFETWSPLGWVLAKGFAALGITGENTLAWHKALWWMHALIAQSLIATMPFSKSMHMLSSFAGLMFKDPLAAARLPPAETRPGAAHAGFAAITDLSWVQLLQLDACTRCGRCHELCPARAAGGPLSPRDLVLDLRACPIVAGGSQTAAALAGGVIAADTVWACTTCAACVTNCPVGVEHVPMIVQLRRRLVEEGALDENLQGTLEKLARQGNSFGQPGRMRARWTRDLDVAVKDARKEAVEYLWFVGDTASYDPRLSEVTRGVARLFAQAGVDFGILYDGEKNSGNDVRRAGEEGLFEMLAEHNAAQLAAARFARIVTTDPHTYNTLRHEYPALGAAYPVLHYTELLADLLATGRLAVSRPQARAVTYHDPCYLGRYGGVYDAPRRVLAAIGCRLVELPRNRERSHCCGAGGGRIWCGDDLYEGQTPAQSRVREAVALGGVTDLVVACPKDQVMFSDAVKTTGSEQQLRVVDISELVAEATRASALGTAGH